MTTRHLLSAAELSRDEAVAILDNADRFRQALLGREIKKLPTLRGRTIITMFYENSTRTRVSFEVAGKWMSADVINVSASGSSAGWKHSGGSAATASITRSTSAPRAAARGKGCAAKRSQKAGTRARGPSRRRNPRSSRRRA